MLCHALNVIADIMFLITCANHVLAIALCVQKIYKHLPLKLFVTIAYMVILCKLIPPVSVALLFFKAACTAFMPNNAHNANKDLP